MAQRLQPHVRRARILETAMSITDAEGHRGLTMARLARECAMSTPGLLHYFPDIDSLLVAVVQHRDERDLSALVAAFSARDARSSWKAPRAAPLEDRGDADAPVAHDGLPVSDLSGLEIPRGMVRDVLDAIVDNIAAHPKAAQLFAHVQAEALDPSHPGHRYFRERADRLARDFARSIGGDRALPTARALFAAMDGMQVHYLRDPQGFDLRAQWAAVADALLDAP